MKEWKVSRRIDGSRFLIRRGWKIWPQYYIYLGLILLTKHRSFAQLKGNLLNIQNYTGGIAHTWSLAVEEHGYLLLVAFLLLALRWRLDQRAVFWILVATTTMVIVLRQVLAQTGHPYFAETHTRIDGILEGVLLSMLYHFRPELFRRVQSYTWLWLLTLGTCVCLLLWLPASKAAISMSYNVANLLGIALLFLLYRHRPDVLRSWVYRVVAWIGLYSYGIYLWHVAVLAPVLWESHRLPSWAVQPWDTGMSLLLGIAVGYATSRAIEFPALRLRDRLFPRRVDSAVGIPAEIETDHRFAAAHAER